jgi:hypothetical protein
VREEAKVHTGAFALLSNDFIQWLKRSRHLDDTFQCSVVPSIIGADGPLYKILLRLKRGTGRILTLSPNCRRAAHETGSKHRFHFPCLSPISC